MGHGRRATEDVDFLALFERDAAETARQPREALALPLSGEDGVTFEPDSLLVEMIWRETASPGARALVQAEAAGAYHALQIDVGFGGPLVPPPQWVDCPATLPGQPLRVLACRAETLVGWKLHGLFEHGARPWRAKDLHDLVLLMEHAPLAVDDLAEAIRVAFASRSQPLADVLPLVYDPARWTTDKARERWAKFRAVAGAAGPPEDLSQVAARVAEALRPALSRLIELPAAGPTLQAADL